MKWNNIKTTIHKELRGIIRDKRSMKTIIYLPFLIPAFILLMGLMFDLLDKSDYDIGLNYEPSVEEKELLTNIAPDINVKTYTDIEAMKSDYKNKNISAYIIRDEKNYTIYTDQSSNSGKVIEVYLSSYLDAYNKSLGNKYLVENGIDLDHVYNNIIVKTENLGSKNSNELITILLSISVTYILMIIVLSCGVVATDATAGEKERATLETILTFPIKSSELITGKYLAIAIFGIILGMVSLIFTFPSIYIGKQLFTSFKDITINISATSISLLVLLILISSFLVAGASMALAGKSKTYKEAQSSLQFLSFLPMLPYFLEILEVDNSIFNIVPIANCGMAMNSIIMDKMEFESLAIIIASTIIYTVLIIIFVSKQYKDEKTLF